MPMWRCPHCGTPQAESSRCWVCKRSSTSCGTCRHFRRAIAGQLGYCGLDRHRLPLRGDEQRGCWQPERIALEEPAARGAAHRPPEPAAARLDFVPLDAVAPLTGVSPVGDAAGRVAEPARHPAPDPGLGFWADEA